MHKAGISQEMMYDDGIMRTIIEIPEEQAIALAEICKSQNISRAEAVRRALAEMLANEQELGRANVFGSWKKRGLDSQSFVESLRKEWKQ